MPYLMYMRDVLMPVTPSEVKLKINNQNSTITLVNGEEILILKSPKLSEVSFDLILPQVPYPFANADTQKADFYLSLFEELKVKKEPFQWILNRTKPNGDPLFHTNLTVGLEDYSIEDNVDEGFDIKVSIKLRQWKAYGTKTVVIQTPPPPPVPTPEPEPAVATVEEPPRETTEAPKTTTYTVKKGDCLWNIAKKYLGKGSRYTEIYELNKDKIRNPNLIYVGQVLTLPA